jgi:hypothetical protein
MLLILITAVGFIGAIIGLTIFYHYSYIQNVTKCRELEQTFNEHRLAYNQSLEYYDYRSNRLDGKFDLVGDLIAWQNYIINDGNDLKHELITFEAQCKSLVT